MHRDSYHNKNNRKRFLQTSRQDIFKVVLVQLYSHRPCLDSAAKKSVFFEHNNAKQYESMNLKIWIIWDLQSQEVGVTAPQQRKHIIAHLTCDENRLRLLLVKLVFLVSLCCNWCWHCSHTPVGNWTPNPLILSALNSGKIKELKELKSVNRRPVVSSSVA